MQESSPQKPGLKTKLFWAMFGVIVTAVGIGAWLESRSPADLILPLSGILFIISGIRSPIPLNVPFWQWVHEETEDEGRDSWLNVMAFILLGVGLFLRLMGDP